MAMGHNYEILIWLCGLRNLFHNHVILGSVQHLGQLSLFVIAPDQLMLCEQIGTWKLDKDFHVCVCVHV